LTLALVLAAALAVLCVLLVALPFLREPEPDSDELDELDDAERRRLELLEQRDRALAALKELEFDHRTGTVSDDDYRALVGPLRRDAASALQALERGTAPSEGPLGRDDRPASEPRRDETGSGAPAGRDGDVGVRHRGPGGG
jgi:hypothetical protein